MCATQPNLVQTSFFLALELLLKTAPLRSIKHRSLTSHSYFRCKTSHWSLHHQKYLSKFQLSHHQQYSFGASTPVVAFLFLGARFYIDSFTLKRKTLIHRRKSHVSYHQKSGSCTLYTKQSVVADVGYLAIFFSP